MIDYFAPAPTITEAILRRIKGNFRRGFVLAESQSGGMDSVPDAWKAHDISEFLKNQMSRDSPSARGGEDLPDLEEGEVEIARMTLLNSVHGEVTSLRARKEVLEGGRILFRMVDEYQSEIILPLETTDAPLTQEQVIAFFKDADPSQTATQCKICFQSFFYQNLDEVVQRMGVK